MSNIKLQYAFLRILFSDSQSMGGQPVKYFDFKLAQFAFCIISLSIFRVITKLPNEAVCTTADCRFNESLGYPEIVKEEVSINNEFECGTNKTKNRTKYISYSYRDILFLFYV